MGYYNLEDLRERYNESRSNKTSAVINNIRVDFRNIKRIDNYFRRVDDDSDEYETGVDDFESALSRFCYELQYKNIPFDRIHITGEPGIILKSSTHREILEDFIKKNYEKSKLASTVPKIEWSPVNSVHYINNLKISDILYNFVPLNFTFEPLITIRDEELNSPKLHSSFDLLGLPKDNEIKYSNIVPLNEFIKEINEDGYHLLFDNDEIKTFEEYFEHMKKILYSNKLTMDIDFCDENNIRR